MTNNLRSLRYTLLASALLAACSTEEPVTTSLDALPTAESTQLAVQTLSTMPWLITGGDVLVEVTLPEGANPAQLQIELNGLQVTGEFKSVSQQRQQALLSGLPLGESTLTARLGNAGDAASIQLTNYPVSGPIISGPQEVPFYCQTAEFTLVNGEKLGHELDANCAVATRVDYVYWSSTDAVFKPWALTDEGVAPTDLAEISVNGATPVPYIVRVETGSVNRAIYEIAMLHDPSTPMPNPWTRSRSWNGKLVYTHGGGCRGGWYQQGDRTGGVMREGLFAQGYAVVSSTLNVFGQNCNDLLASETHIMVKERFIEHYGVPVYTIATGASGGSYQSHQTADNYPGIFDGIIVSSSFPDVTSATIFTLADARLLQHYFTTVNPEDFTRVQQQAIAGFGSWGSLPNLSRGAARLDPLYAFDTLPEEQGGEVSLPVLESERYSKDNPEGVRATVYDHTVNVYGTIGNSAIAQRPLDNVGVQYGLLALNNGVITPQQFIELNRDIGGFDRDMNHSPDRHRADPEATRKAIESGRVLYGGGGLEHTPVIDYRSYTDHAVDGDIHMIVHQFSTRQRLQLANGHADNHVMRVGGQWGFTEEQPDLGELFRAMDAWLMAIQADTSDTEPGRKVVNARPVDLTDACWDNTGRERVRIDETQTYAGGGQCGALYPAYSTPRQVAGAPLANNIVSCVRRPLNPADYAVTFTPEETLELQSVFPDGVCDWSRGDASGASFQGTWLSFGPSPVNRL